VYRKNAVYSLPLYTALEHEDSPEMRLRRHASATVERFRVLSRRYWWSRCICPVVYVHVYDSVRTQFLQNKTKRTFSTAAATCATWDPRDPPWKYVPLVIPMAASAAASQHHSQRSNSGGRLSLPQVSSSMTKEPGCRRLRTCIPKIWMSSSSLCWLVQPLPERGSGE